MTDKGKPNNGATSRPRAVVISAADNVATLIDDAEAGAICVLTGAASAQVAALERIAFGHKVAARDVTNRGDIVKYGEIIGRATSNIRAGEHVHVHNVESLRGRGDLVMRKRNG